MITDMDAILAIVARQKVVYGHQPVCPMCSSPQVQVVRIDPPAGWRCRECKHSFVSEP